VPGRPRAHRFKLTIHQPSNATLERLSSLQADRFVVHAVHVAVDFRCADAQQTRLATEFLTRGVVQKWRRPDHRSHLEENTRYWKRDGKAPRNIALYGDRPSKIGLGLGPHFEMRFTGAAACKRAGLADLRLLSRGVSAENLLERQAWIAFIDPEQLDRVLESVARKGLRATQRRRPGVTLGDIKLQLRRLLARCLQDDDRLLDQDTVANARSQNLLDYQPLLRACLKRFSWSAFMPTPRWHGW